MGKFDSKGDYGIFLGYLETSAEFRVYNSRTLVEEAIHIRFDENKYDKDLLELDESFVDLGPDDNSIATSSSK